VNSRSLARHIGDSQTKEDTLPEGERIHASLVVRVTDTNPLEPGDAVDLELNEQELAQEIQLGALPVPFQVYLFNIRISM
jgi:positive regulator of sigma E activity